MRKDERLQYLYLNDLTELPGLDELSAPSGPIQEIEKRSARLWGAQDSIISINGATAGIIAAMLAVSYRGGDIIVPRNAHRSVISGLVLSGLNPVWFEPEWDADWGIWGPVTASAVHQAIDASPQSAAVLIVSPTYPGALSMVSEIADLCHKRNIPLIVDEAHGAHFLPDTAMPRSSLAQHADIVVHSLHKTMPALTQTGLVHVSPQSLVKSGRVRAAVNLLQSSSPSYPLLLSIEEAIGWLADGAGKNRLEEVLQHCSLLRNAIPAQLQLYSPACGSDPFHLFMRPASAPAADLHRHLDGCGIVAEAAIGSGLLLLLGTGTSQKDGNLLLSALESYRPRCQSVVHKPEEKPPLSEQVLTPRQAFFSPSESVPASAACGRIAAETVAPCPPGTPAVIAGQRVPSQIAELANLRNLKVVVD